MLKILQLDKNSIAQKIGLKKDDIIVAFDGKKAQDMLDVAYYDNQSYGGVHEESIRTLCPGAG